MRREIEAGEGVVRDTGRGAKSTKLVLRGHAGVGGVRGSTIWQEICVNQ